MLTIHTTPVVDTPTCRIQRVDSLDFEQAVFNDKSNFIMAGNHQGSRLVTQKLSVATLLTVVLTRGRC